MHDAPALPSVRSALLGVTLVVWLVSEWRRARHQRADAARATVAPRGRRGRLAGPLAVATLIALAARRWFPRADLHATAVLAGAGLGLAWLGLALRWWSFATLGDYFTFTVMASPDQPVVARGPYRLVRHPSYVGVIAIVVGIAIARANVVGVAVALVLAVGGAVARIHVEERLLVEILGARYEQYARGRARLVPGLW